MRRSAMLMVVLAMPGAARADIDWGIVAQATAGFGAGLLGLLLGAAGGYQLGCSLETVVRNGHPCSQLAALPAVAAGMGLGFGAGWLAIDAVQGELTEGWGPATVNVGWRF